MALADNEGLTSSNKYTAALKTVHHSDLRRKVVGPNDISEFDVFFGESRHFVQGFGELTVIGNKGLVFFSWCANNPKDRDVSILSSRTKHEPV